MLGREISNESMAGRGDPLMRIGHCCAGWVECMRAIGGASEPRLSWIDSFGGLDAYGELIQNTI